MFVREMVLFFWGGEGGLGFKDNKRKKKQEAKQDDQDTLVHARGTLIHVCVMLRGFVSLGVGVVRSWCFVYHFCKPRLGVGWRVWRHIKTNVIQLRYMEIATCWNSLTGHRCMHTSGLCCSLHLIATVGCCTPVKDTHFPKWGQHHTQAKTAS